MKLIIAGSSDITNYQLVKDTLASEVCSKDTITEVVSGCAHGADALGERWAKEQGIPITRMPADWGSYGKRAGYIRNSEMSSYADACIVFWNGTSKGSKHMIDIAKRKPHMKLVVVTVTDLKLTEMDFKS